MLMRAFSIFFLLCSTLCFSGEQRIGELIRKANSDTGKRYVHLDQVALTAEGIFVELDGTWVLTSALERDDSGLFVSEWSITWTCPKCQYENGPFSRSCVKCGYKPKH